MKNTTYKPVAGYERRDLEQFLRLNARHAGPSVRGAPEGNTNHLKHGAYANRFLSPDEQEVFHGLVGKLREDFASNASSDLVQVELAGIYFLKLARALGEENYDAAHKLDQMLRGHLKDLKATKLSRDTSDTSEPATTPAEWATTLLERLAEAERREQVDCKQRRAPHE